jgi:hypothetical protein
VVNGGVQVKKTSGTSTKAPVNFTPTGSAGGGEAPPERGINTLMLQLGVIVLAAASSWSVYYFLRPAKD